MHLVINYRFLVLSHCWYQRIAKHQLVNFKISLDRALAVASELIRLSVSNDQIIIKAVGASQLRYLESMPSGEAGNRRVEILLTSMI